MRRFRFSLLGLLLTTTLLALFLGYAEWRRRYVIREYETLRAEGVTISPLSGSWWPVGPPTAIIIFRVSKDSDLTHYRSRYTFAEAEARYFDWEARLKDIGVQTVQLAVHKGGGIDSLVVIEDAADLKEVASRNDGL